MQLLIIRLTAYYNQRLLYKHLNQKQTNNDWSMYNRTIIKHVNCTYIYIYVQYIYIKGVTVHKIHGSVRYDTVVSRFGSARGQLVTSQCWKYFCFEP